MMWRKRQYWSILHQGACFAHYFKLWNKLADKKTHVSHLLYCVKIMLKLASHYSSQCYMLSHKTSLRLTCPQPLNTAWKLHCVLLYYYCSLGLYNACIVWKHTSEIPTLFTKTVNKWEAPLSPKPQFLLSSVRASIIFEDEVILWIMLYNSNAQLQISRRITTDGTNRRNRCRDARLGCFLTDTALWVDLQIVHIVFKFIL